MADERLSVTRYVPTYVNAEGRRTLMLPMQGRHTFATAEEAQAWIDGVLGGTDADKISQVWGASPRFEVRECPCWPVHHDPQTCWFD